VATVNEDQYFGICVGGEVMADADMIVFFGVTSDTGI